MYKQFEIHLKFRDKIFGGHSKDKDVLQTFVQTKLDSKDTSPTDTDLDLTEETDKRTNQFRKDEIGIYIGDYQIKAMLTEAASLLGITMKKRGSKQTLKEGLIVAGLKNTEKTDDTIYLLPLKTEVDGIHVHTGNVSGPQGNRSIVKAMEFVEQPEIQFTLSVLENRISVDAVKSFSTLDLKKCLAHGRELGLGAHRKYGGGRFDVLKFEELQPLTDADIIDF